MDGCVSCILPGNSESLTCDSFGRDGANALLSRDAEEVEFVFTGRHQVGNNDIS